MARVHAPEIEDEAWCPVVVRDGLTGFLQVAVEFFGLYDAAVDVVGNVVDAHAARGGPRTLIDLCSGGGGPLLRMQETLARRERPVDAVLTDLYPNLGAFSAAEVRGQGRVRGVRDSVDATDVPADLSGVRTMFNALHHFRPELARAIVADAARKRQPFVSLEIVERRPQTVAFLMGTPIAALALAPFARPLTPGRLLLTYALPLIPLGVWWDGMMSCLRSYAPGELRALCAGLDDDGYAFRVDVIDVPIWPVRITALIGEPR